VRNITGILMDEETGDPVLDDYNNTIQIDDKLAFEQIISGLFHCDVGSEIMHPKYGFDLKSALRESYASDKEMFIESLVMQALDPQKEKLISEVNDIKAVRDGSSMNVTVLITSVLGDSIILEESVG